MDKMLKTLKNLIKEVPMWAKAALCALGVLCVFLLVLLLMTGSQLNVSESASELAQNRMKGSLQTEVNSLYRSYEKLSLTKYDNEEEVMPEMRILLHGVELLNTSIANCYSVTVIPSNLLTAVSSTLDTLDTLLENKNDITKATSQLGNYLDQIREITG